MMCAVGATACGSVSGNRADASIDAPQPDALLTIDASTIDGPAIDGPTIDAMTCVSSPMGLDGRWRGEMNANDDVPNGHNGVTVGSSFNYVPGKHGFAFQLDGSTNAVTIDEADTLWPEASFSLEAWVKTTDSGSPSHIVSKYQCGSLCPVGSNALWGLWISRTGHPGFEFRSDAMSVATNVADGQNVISDGQWHHLVGVRDTTSGSARLYIDGVLRATTSLSVEEMGPMTNTDGSEDLVVIGGQIVGGTNSLVDLHGGAIDEVSYYAIALSQSQVAAIYAAPDGVCH
jgi:hypothetical protein